MKKLITLLILLFCINVQAQDTTYTVTTMFFADTLTSTRDTVVLSIKNNYGYWSITLDSDSLDTVYVDTKTFNINAAGDYYWTQKALIDMSADTVVTSAAVTTTPKEFLILDPRATGIRLRSTVATNTAYIIQLKNQGAIK